MVDAFFLLALAAFVLLSTWVYWQNRRRVDNRLAESFRELVLSSDGVIVRGADLQVVKKVRSLLRASRRWTLMPKSAAMAQGETFWYCRGPDARWFLAIPTVECNDRVYDVSWVVRPLTEQRVRAVLQFDRKACQRAFGERDAA